MDLLQSLVEIIASAARRIWPAVLGAALFGYLGGSAGLWAFVIASALGALVGTWAGGWLGLVPIQAMTGNRNADLGLYAAGAFMLVGLGYLMLQFALILAFLAAIVLVAAAWFAG